ncbi:MAG: hypothetical protein ACRDPW_07545 [Mycobacteriales bacterium]
MAAKKMSISLDAELARTIRAAAHEADVSLSTWFSEAAASRVRQQRLRYALSTSDPEVAALSDTQLDHAVTQARQASFMTTPQRHAA